MEPKDNAKNATNARIALPLNEMLDPFHIACLPFFEDGGSKTMPPLGPLCS
jgi:hypothetical protein